VADAARRARGRHERQGALVEQLALVGEAQRHVVGAVAQAERVGELAHRLLHVARAGERPVPHAAVAAPGGALDHLELGRRAARELDERPVPRVALHEDVVPRAPALDEPQLAQQRGELARRVLPLEVRESRRMRAPLSSG
jgi:hypothetical protein